MKAMICDKKGKLKNILKDTEKEFIGHTYITITEIDFELPKEGLLGAINDKYYLDGTILKKRTQSELEQTTDYILELKSKLRASYSNLEDGPDSLLYDALEELLKDTPKGKKWLSEKEKIKTKVKKK